MAEFSLWLEKSPSIPPVKVTVEDSIPVFKLKEILLAQLDLPGAGSDGKPASYQIICLRNGMEEDDIQDEPRSQSMAFFLVGDDEGEFAWIAEDECRLFPLKE